MPWAYNLKLDLVDSAFIWTRSLFWVQCNLHLLNNLGIFWHFCQPHFFLIIRLYMCIKFTESQINFNKRLTIKSTKQDKNKPLNVSMIIKGQFIPSMPFFLSCHVCHTDLSVCSPYSITGIRLDWNKHRTTNKCQYLE